MSETLPIHKTTPENYDQFVPVSGSWGEGFKATDSSTGNQKLFTHDEILAANMGDSQTSQNPGRLRETTDRALASAKQRAADFAARPERPSDERIREVFSQPPGSSASVGVEGETAVISPPVAESSEAPTSVKINVLEEPPVPVASEALAPVAEAPQDTAAQIGALTKRIDEMVSMNTQLLERLEDMDKRLREMGLSDVASEQRPGVYDQEAEEKIPNSILKIDGRDANGDPFIIRKLEDGSWKLSKNGENPSQWFDIDPQNVPYWLGLEASRPNAEGAPVGDADYARYPGGERHRVQPPPTETPADEAADEEVEEVDSEKMDEALAAAWAAMEAGHASFDEAKAELKKAIETWNGQTSELAGDGATLVTGSEAAKAGGEVGKPEKRSRLKKHGKKVIGALLLVAAGAAGYYLHKYTGHGPSGNIPGIGGESNIPGTGGVERVPGAIDHTESLSYYGDTIWAHGKASLTQAMGGHTPKNWQIMEWSKQTMNLPGNRGHLLQHGKDIWDGARHLPVGWKFTVNENITRLIAQRGA